MRARVISAAFGSVALAALVGAAVVPLAYSAPAAPSADEHGFVDSSARCSGSQTLMAYGSTARALVVICVDPDGELQYRGVRLGDGATLQMAAGRGSDGSIVATNDSVTYSVSPAAFLVSEGDTVLYRDSWTVFQTPRFSGGSATATTSAAPPTSAAPTTSAPATGSTTGPTVSTTTVTMPPKR